jgi:hypothetical protein
MKKMFCTKCGKKLNGTWERCPNCGNELEIGTVQDDNIGGYLRKYCPDCGERLSREAVYCGKCGREMISSEVYANMQDSTHRMEKMNNPLTENSTQLDVQTAMQNVGRTSFGLQLPFGNKTVRIVCMVIVAAVVIGIGLFLIHVMGNSRKVTDMESQSELVQQLGREEEEAETIITQFNETNGMANQEENAENKNRGTLEDTQISEEIQSKDTQISQEVQSIEIDSNYIDFISASSELSDTTKTYKIDNILDGNRDTCWCEGVEGIGENEYLEIRFKDSLYLTEIDFLNGYMKNEEVFCANGKIMSVEFLFSDGSSYQVDLKKAEYQEVENALFSDFIVFEKPILTESLRITILEAEAGTKYDDICLTELGIWGYQDSNAGMQQDAGFVMSEGEELYMNSSISGTYGCYMGEDLGAEITLAYDEENKSLYIEGNCWSGMNVGMIEKGMVSEMAQDGEALLYDDGYGNQIFIYLLDTGELDVRQKGEFGGVGTTFEGIYERISW